MYYLKVEQSFDAAHFLADYRGKCSNIHGHRWRVVIEIQSETLREDRQERGMCVDFSILKEELRKIVDKLDHNFLVEQGTLREKTVTALAEEGFTFLELPFRPTAENFARYFYDLLTERGYPVSLAEVYETPNNCASYRS